MSKPHPLDILTADEIRKTVKIIKSHPKFSDISFIFNSITRLEPLKELLLPYLRKEDEGRHEELKELTRRAFAVLIQKFHGKAQVIEVVVNLTSGEIEIEKDVEVGNQPTLTPEDCLNAEKIVYTDPTVIARCKELGLEDMSLVVADPWSFGYNGDGMKFENRRLVQLFMYFRNFPEDNHYAHPLPFVPIVDLIEEIVIDIEDVPCHGDFKVKKEEKIELQKVSSNYDPEYNKDEGITLRTDLKPLDIVQREGPSFTVEGNLVKWQKFSFRISFNYRQGLLLHNVCYQDKDKLRPLFYRMGISEMVVPYGDTRPPFHRKSAFDVGDYGLGFCANSLVQDCDCVGEIKYFDGMLNNHAGEPVVLKNCICLHEEDAGLLWKHTEYRTGKVSSARDRKLVVSFIVTVVNYEYAIYWNFHLDGTIRFEIKATGELSTNLLQGGLEEDSTFGHASRVMQNVGGQYHQHIFSCRIDPQIDGQFNTISAVDVVPLEGTYGSDTNPYGQGFTLKEQVLDHILTAHSNISPMTSRTWKIMNKDFIHPITGQVLAGAITILLTDRNLNTSFFDQPVAWKLIPTNSQPLCAKEGSYIRNRAQFAENSLWVTPFKDKEKFAAGFYVNQSKGYGHGLLHMVEEHEKEGRTDLVQKDIVLWHSFGVTHIPRVEDFPVMPSETCGFTLKPCNFFMCNPALDVPPTKMIGNKSENGGGKCAAKEEKKKLDDESE